MPIENWKPKHSEEEKEKRHMFGIWFKKIRTTHNVSIKAAAKQMNISEDMVHRIERGCVSPECPGLYEKIMKLSERKKLVIA